MKKLFTLFFVAACLLLSLLVLPVAAQTVPRTYPRPTEYVPDALPADSPAEVAAAYNFVSGVIGFPPLRFAWIVAHSQTVEAMYDAIDAELALLPD